jgi:hypothetical protein
MIRALEIRKGGVRQPMKGVPATCHPNRPAKTRGLCASCYLRWLKEKNPKLAERQRKNCRQWYKAHKEHVAKHHKKYSEYRAKQDPLWNWARGLRYRFGMTPDDYERILASQGGVCAICGKPPKPGKHLAIDHNHSTGNVRGLLCFRCNFGLSYFSEDPSTLFRAYQFLSKIS